MCAVAETSHSARRIIIWTSRLPEPADASLIDRFGVFPREFHDGALNAGFELARGDTPALLYCAVRRAKAEGRKAMIFIYSLRPFDLLALTLYAGLVPTVIYYQNIDPSLMPWHRRLFVRYCLGRARLILLQDALRLAAFQCAQNAGRARFFPWVVDDAFFSPTPGVARTDALFVPGDRARLDDVVIEIARRTSRRIVRVSRYFPEAVLAAYAACPNVDLRYYVRWEELLRLYQESAMVLNVVEDTHTSAGMTSFLEGLAMNTLVITPSGHSSAGYQFSDGFKPYLTITNPRSVDEWIAAIEAADRNSLDWPAGRTPRDLFLKFSGMTAAGERWHALFDEATA